MDISADRRYAEEAAVVLAGMGRPTAYGRLLGWLLICQPAGQSGAELVEGFRTPAAAATLTA